MPQPSKEPCKKEACNIQACLTKYNFLPQKCLLDFVDSAEFMAIELATAELEANWCIKVIELLQACCEKYDYKSTHCASVSGLLKEEPK